MNEYKINITEVLKKTVIVKAENPDEALKIIQKRYMKPNLKEFKNENLFEIDAKIIEENGEIIEKKEQNYEDTVKENNHLNFEEIDSRLFRMEKVLSRMLKLEKYINEKMDFIKDFAENAVKMLEDIEKTIN